MASVSRTLEREGGKFGIVLLTGYRCGIALFGKREDEERSEDERAPFIELHRFEAHELDALRT